MKKLIYIFTILLTTIFFINPVKAVEEFRQPAETPVYDATFDNNSGALYANGTPVTITTNAAGNTVANWEGGSQVLTDTTTVFGGGVAGTNYDTSNITMEDGTVLDLVGGGVSTDENNPANVGKSNITVNGGTVTANVTGGGFLFSEVQNANITMNDGTARTVLGGGFAALTIDGVTYAAGTEEEPENSGNRTENTNIVINDGTVTDTVFGGGQGYSYVGNANTIINGGDLSTVYVTAGGSNGYTRNANVNITGGDIGVYQTVNRGEMETANVSVTGGTIDRFYVGGETEDPQVTGTINKIDTELLSGNIGTLNPGTNGAQPITIDDTNFTVVKSDTINVEQDNIPSGEQELTYDLQTTPETLQLTKGENAQIQANVTTNLPEYQERLENQVVWTSSDENVATVTQDGVVTANNPGNATITATLLDKQDTTDVDVQDNTAIFLLLWILLPLAVVLILAIILDLIGIDE